MKPKHLHILAFFEQVFLDGRTTFFALIGVMALLHWTWWEFTLLFLAWFTFEGLDYWMRRYWLTENELVLTSGILRRKWRHLPYQKIQNIHRSQWFFLKPFRLEKIAVDSGGQGGERENQITLPVIPTWVTWVIEQKHQNPNTELDVLLEIADQQVAMKSEDFSKALLDKTGDRQDHHLTVKDGKEVEHKTSVKELFLYALTAPEVLLQFAIVFGFLGRLDSHVHVFETISDEVSTKSVLMIVGVVIAFLVVLFIFNIIKTVILYYDFTFSKKDGHLQIQRGLFEVRGLTFAENRIQSLQIEQNLWRNLLKLATVRLRLITDKSGDDEVQRKLPTMFPLVKSKEANDLAHAFLPSLVPEKKPAIKSGSFFQSWAMARNAVVYLGVILAVALYFWLNTYSVMVAIFLLVLGALSGYYKGRVTGTAIVEEGKVLVLQTARLFNKKTVYVKCENIQSVSLTQSFWMALFNKRAHLIVVIRTNDGSAEIETRYLPLQEARAIYAAYQAAYQK
ncbi:PH domain-containing protein [Fructobacillus sp. M2-14]|uniref:PH domain-containing protein n=1 Tax=Fructobacillus broussonetiae TaxID=2713173 RepID=A0ABS5QZB2_9LACO|nr:PH domain-containing protein [Fructobacillus broussonetiae]MBS9338117.1 PH domain-containing protein [Fructobacillus broussonetiae]